MEILPLQFKTLYYCGVWSEKVPVSFLYLTYKLFVILIIFWYTLSHNIEFVRNTSVDVLYLSVPYIALCIKIGNFTLCSNEITNLRKKFSSKIFIPSCQEEWDILKKYKREGDMLFLSILSLTLSCGIGILMLPFINKGYKTFTLPLDIYQPYSNSNWGAYFFSYIWQILGSIYGILLNVSTDTMVYGFLLFTCAQYDIFCLRLKQIGEKDNSIFIKHYIDHHVFIQNLAKDTQSFFMRTVIVIFCCSFVTLAASIFNVIQVRILSLEFLTRIAFYTCMLLEIFLYCYYGHKLTEKSHAITRAIYNSNWIKLDYVHRRGLKFIMLISTKGFVMSHHGLCILNLNTFALIVKASYTALNVLQYGVNV